MQQENWYTTMTNSIILPNDNVTKILNAFLNGDISLFAMQSMLKGIIEIDFDQAPLKREIRENLISEEVRILVNNFHLLHMLQNFLAGNISVIDLSNWAALIYMLPNFFPEGDTENEQWEAGEGVLWVILQELTTPQVVDRLNVREAFNYLTELTHG
jgi:hypothetical protein